MVPANAKWACPLFTLLSGIHSQQSKQTSKELPITTHLIFRTSQTTHASMSKGILILLTENPTTPPSQPQHHLPPP